VTGFNEREQIGRGWVRPTLLAGGTPEQQARWLPGIEDGTESWCQLFSEPEAGSDLASLRTRAERDGNSYVVTGQKIWTTWADVSKWGILLARTDPDVAPHRGISYFVLDMEASGIDVRPIVEMTGGHHFNEVFLTNVRVPIEHRIGEEGDGWKLATLTLASERDALSEGGVIWGMGPTSDDLFDVLRKQGGVEDPVLRQDVARVYTEKIVLDLLAESAAPSVRKCLADEHGQHVMSLMIETRGPYGLLGEHGEHLKHEDVWLWGYLFSRALTIGGGTAEVQRNVIAERLLGLPR
jgi:alkylation response protein AidB-like acyl-CoA dehydrogenase